MEIFVKSDFVHDTKMIKTLKNCEKLLNCLFSMKMMAILSRIFWLSIWLISAIGHLSAQQLNGLAIDRINAEPVTFASIRVNDVNAAIADSLGHFTITLPAGRSVISISKVGYVTYFQTVNLSEDDHVSMRFLLERYTNELQRVVISSSKQEKVLAREAVSIVSIQPYLITNTNSNTLSDVLNRVPGISVVDGQAIIRGGVGWSYNVGSRVMVLLDDMPLMGPDAGDVQWDLLPIEAAENIEVMKGPASVLYGSSASSGTVSLHTGWPTHKPETKIQVYQGITANPKRAYTAWWDNTSQPFNSGTFFSHKQKFGLVDVVWSGNLDMNKGYIEFNDQYRARTYVKSRYRIKSKPGLSVGINGTLLYKKGGRFFLWQDADSNILRPYTGSVGEDNYRIWSLDPHITYAPSDKYTFSFKLRHYNITRFVTNIHAFNRLNNADANIQAADINLFRRWSSVFTTTSGIYLTRMWAVGNVYPGNHAGYSAAAFTQGEYQYKKRLTLTLGLRYEFNALGSIEKSPGPLLRAGANYQAAKQTYIRATYGEGFRFPTVSERFIDDKVNRTSNLVILPNPGLENEYGWYTEIGVKQGFQIGGVKATIDCAMFWQEYRNLIQFEFKQWTNDTFYIDYSYSPPVFKSSSGVIGFKAINMGNTRTAGIELSLEGEGSIGPVGIRTLCGYTYIYPVDLDADTALKDVGKYMWNFLTSFDGLNERQLQSVLPYRNRKLIKADVELTYKKIGLGYGLFYYSVYDKIDAALFVLVPGIQQFLRDAAPGDWLHNIRVSYAINPNTTVAFLVNNLTNHEYAIRLARLEQPRNFNLQLRLRF